MGKLIAKRFCIGFGCGRISNNKRSSSSSISSSISSSSSLSSSSLSSSSSSSCNNNNIKWEMRPGGMLVQKRSQEEEEEDEDLIRVKVSTVSKISHQISIDANSTFGELKMVIAMVSGIKAKEQRLLFKGKEREDKEYLHMVGVGNGDKLFLLQDPSFKDLNLLNLSITL